MLTLAFFPRSILPRPAPDHNKEGVEYYLRKNDEEKRLTEFRDNDKALKLKLKQLDIINQSRKKYNAPPVKLDILASRVANKMCREAAVNNFTGHWNMAGEKPYHRYAFAGGYDHVSENAYGEWSSVNYSSSGSDLEAMMKHGHTTFMEEKAPFDGHKKTIIGKSHNFVGIGYCLSGKQFRYYEEFIDRLFEFEDIPVKVNAGKPFTISVKTDPENFLYFVTIYHEKFPQALSPVQIKRKGSYDDFTDEVYQNIYAWDLARYRSGTTYRIPLDFSKEGLYYIQIFTDRKEITRAGSLNTRDKTAYSGIVIRVNK